MGPSLTSTNNIGLLVSTTSDNAGLESTDEALDSTKAGFDELGATAAETSDTVSESIAKTTEATDLGADDVRASLAVQIAAYRAYAEAVAESQAEVDAANAGADTDKATESVLGKVGLGGIGGAATGILAVVAGLGVAVKSAADFQTAMLKLYNTAGETANYNALSAGISQVADNTGEAVSQLLQAQYHLSSIGYNGLSGINLLKAAAQGAREEGADVTTVANALGTVMHDYGANASQATSYMDQLISATSVGNVTLQDLTGSLSTVLPLASKVGLSFSQIGAAEATLTEGGVSANESTQDLSALIKSLIAPTSQQVAAMQQMGLNSVTLGKDLGTQGLTGTLNTLMAAVLAHTKDGQVIQSAFNQAQLATQDLNTELNNSPPALQTLENQLLTGSIGFAAYKKAVQALPESMYAMGESFQSGYEQTTNFNKQLAAGVNASPTVVNELKTLTGQSNSMNAVLLLTGANQAVFDANNTKIANSAKNAGSNVQGWSDQQKTLNTQLDEAWQRIQTLGRGIGTDLEPALKGALSGFNGLLGDLTNPSGFTAGVKSQINDLVNSWLGLNDATKKTSGTLADQLSPQMKEELALASQMGVSVQTVTTKQSLLTQATVEGSNAFNLLTTANAQDKTATELSTTANKNLATQTGIVQQAQTVVNTLVQKGTTNSPQYQTAVSNLAGAQQTYNAKLETADSDMLNLLISGSNLKSAEDIWSGSTYNLGKSQDVVNDALNKGVDVVAKFGPTASQQLTAIASLQTSLGLVVSTWNGLQNSINIQQTQDTNIFQGDTSDLIKVQSQATTLNSTLSSASSSLSTLQGASASIQGGTLKLTSGYATGTNNYPGGIAMFGENGPEAAILPAGSQVLTKSQTESAMGGGGGRGSMNSSGGGTTIYQTNYNYSMFDLTAANKELGFQLANQ